MKKQKGFTLAELVLVVALIVQGVVMGLVLYVTVHFISKFW